MNVQYAATLHIDTVYIPSHSFISGFPLVLSMQKHCPSLQHCPSLHFGLHTSDESLRSIKNEKICMQENVQPPKAAISGQCHQIGVPISLLL